MNKRVFIVAALLVIGAVAIAGCTSVQVNTDDLGGYSEEELAALYDKLIEEKTDYTYKQYDDYLIKDDEFWDENTKEYFEEYLDKFTKERSENVADTDKNLVYGRDVDIFYKKSDYGDTTWTEETKKAIEVIKELREELKTDIKDYYLDKYTEYTTDENGTQKIDYEKSILNIIEDI